MSKTKIYCSKPSITEKEVTYDMDAARNGWGDSCCSYFYQFGFTFKKAL